MAVKSVHYGGRHVFTGSCVRSDRGKKKAEVMFTWRRPSFPAPSSRLKVPALGSQRDLSTLEASDKHTALVHDGN